MPIKATCECGKSVAAPDQFAGKRVKCPGCGKAIVVPRPAAKHAANDITDLFDEVDLTESETGRRCPMCRRDLQPEDVICVACGYNTETGKKIVTRKKAHVDHPDRPTRKSKGFAQPVLVGKVKLLTNLLNAVGILALVGVVVFAALSMAGISLTGASTGSTGGVPSGDAATTAVIYIVVVFVLVTVPYCLTSYLVKEGKPIGRTLSMILGILAIPVVLGILILVTAISEDVAKHCK